MGKLKDSLLSGSSGRVGRLVVANVAGTEILRVRPKKSTKPPSAKQVLIQSRMSRAYDFIFAYKAYASLYYGQKLGMRSCYNQAISNILNAIMVDYDNQRLEMDYGKIEFSNGKLLPALPVGLQVDPQGGFQIQWFDNSGNVLVRQSDELQVLYIAEDDFRSTFMENTARREERNVSILTPPSMQGKNLHVWIAFRAEDRSSASRSIYIGSVEMP